MARWKTGESGNPNGRSSIQQRLDQAFRRSVYQLWREHGERCLEQMIETRPADFCRLVASMLPRQTQMELSKTEPQHIDIADAVKELGALAERLGWKVEQKELPHFQPLDTVIKLPAKGNGED